ncbi:pseudouridine synthase [Desulfurobacterium atlanticum]|uniref:Pseudouridine synthase n=1 Tax=Desulfurobacterium atlanticum TaxID=240169 RepID=A0A239AB93_9BACT|nr:pseudouridine synthase [Desulfurobacterium atlanticum]SNR92611.1 16S rRNA pseudouridine516 synthase [Desulfurobacterium atlanticum]
MASKLRLDKLLSESGFGTRKEVKYLIKKGTVTVNGEQIKDPGFKVDPEKEKIEVNGEPVIHIKDIYLILHKPAGYITSTKDKEATVMELISDVPRFEKLFPVGRLDKDTEGLLFITNDGELAHRLTHPKWKVPKRYYVVIEGKLSENSKNLLEKGVKLGDFISKPAKVKVIKVHENTSEIEIEITEGKYHQIKRMLKKVGNPVIYLKRISFGTLKLGKLPKGEYRFLNDEEVKKLKKAVGLLPASN